VRELPRRRSYRLAVGERAAKRSETGKKRRPAGGTADALQPCVRGAITSRDVLLHSVTIVRLWGPSCYLRCLRAIVSRRPCTFLEVIASS
jgi:hypothetical protein